jgi:dTDP-4-dehydrorhamnose reductase
MKFLISGRNGQLATAFRRILSERSADYLAPEESDFDVTDADRISAVCDSYRPEVIINCAAYNLVDRAEEETDTAFSINASGPGLLADCWQARLKNTRHSLSISARITFLTGRRRAGCTRSGTCRIR